MFPIIDLGPFAIQAPGLILILSLLVGIWLTGRLSDSLDTNGEVIENALLIALIAGILGARLGFMLQNPGILLDNPLALLSLTPSMFDPGFGILVGGLAAFILAQKNHLPLWPTLDTLTPLSLLVFMAVHLANFAGGNAYGMPTTLPWGIRLWGEQRHPVQLYAVLLALFVFIWFLGKTRVLAKTGYPHSGLLASIVFSSAAAITLITRGFVSEKITILNVDIIQISAFILLALGLWLVYRKKYSSQKNTHVIISMGSNKNAHDNLHSGVEKLSERFEILRSSSIYQTTDVRDQIDGKTFLNQLVEIETSLPFPKLNETLKTIETEQGRELGNKDSVPLDLDILIYNGQVFVHDDHQIPDPDLIKYRYLAEPLAEMTPDFRHPASGKTIEEILNQLQDEQEVIKLKEVENGING